MKSRKLIYGVCMFLLLAVSSIGSAQSDFAATLEVLNPGVEVLRVNTRNPIRVSVEAIVGVGDLIQTDSTGRVRITFFADGTDVILEPNTQYRIVEFRGDDTDFRLLVEVVIGQTLHRLSRSLGSNSSYDVRTPGMTLAARGTTFTVRVRDDGRSAMLVNEGVMTASADESSAQVPAEFGVRADQESGLSDVVRATTFEALDSALDGCAASVTTPDDVRLNVRLGPSRDLPRVGSLAAEEIDRFFGVSETGGWYRVAYRGNFGWVLSSNAKIEDTCAGLRVFANEHREDPDLYEALSDPLEVLVPQPSVTETGEETDTQDQN